MVELWVVKVPSTSTIKPRTCHHEEDFGRELITRRGEGRGGGGWVYKWGFTVFLKKVS